MITYTFATPLDFEGSIVRGIERLPFEKGAYAGAGTIESPEIAAPPFDELVGSWSATLPRGAWLELRAQARVAGRWSAWYALGRWDGGEGGRSLGEQADRDGRVDVDTLRLKAPAEAFRFRVELGGAGATLERVAIALSDTKRAPALPPFRPGAWVRELDVRPRSQMDAQEKYRHDICSPTSLSMVLDFWGRRLPTESVADAVRDRASTLFGNWPLNVAFAALQGVPGEVARLDMAGLEREIAEGRPVIASISFSTGELRGAPIRETNGHLLVVAGFTRKGDVIVRDPAGRGKAVRRVYRREDFQKVWAVRKRGLAYVLGPRLPRVLAAGAESVDLRRKPDPSDPLATQLLYGERARALSAQGDWIEVEALEQLETTDGKLAPYRGWVPASQLRSINDGRAPDAVVVERAELGLSSGTLSVDLGTKVVLESSSASRAALRLVDGRAASIPAARLRRLGPPPDRARILEHARQFLGEPYVWGGRSATGVDCSGLTSLSYRAEGVELPRDAQDQFLESRRVRRSRLKPADLVFLSQPGDPKTVTHVMLYAGADGLIESRQAGGKTLETTFKERFGQSLSEIESGQTVTDLSGDKPDKRTIYFGSFL